MENSLVYFREVYPRVCGGSASRRIALRGEMGLSPRVRGKRLAAFPAAFFAGSIPACAGEAIGNIPQGVGQIGLSPRVRGKLLPPTMAAVVRGSIPACAGEAYRDCDSAVRMPVYPRVCGGSAFQLAAG